MRPLVSVTLEKREGACALFVQKLQRKKTRSIGTPDCKSTVSQDTLLCELLRQATVERRRLKARRAVNYAIAVLYASPLLSAMHAASCFRNVVVSLLAPPVAKNTSGANAALATSWTLSSYWSRFSFSCRRYVDGMGREQYKEEKGFYT